MENIIPINGRIAIIDDKIDQALPLMRVFSKNNIPYTFYDGNDSESFPEIPENDIRILFLDLNLLGGKTQKEKEIKSSLVNTLKHILSPNNYPYILILWSRQEKEYKKVVEEIFNNELKDRAPIAIESYIKSDFFPNFAEEIDDTKDKQILLDTLNNILKRSPTYCHLIQWENCVHNSADATIQSIFHDSQSQTDWHKNANCIFDMFAHSYLEKQYSSSDSKKKTIASLLFFNDIFQDTLEQSVEKIDVEDNSDLEHNIDIPDREKIKAKVNSCLLISNQCDSINQPGSVICMNDYIEEKQLFEDLIDNSLMSLPKTIKKEDIYKTLVPCRVVVTPVCDYAQNKFKFDRIVQGVIVDEKYKKYIDNSEAIYCSPTFEYESSNKVMVLNFRYFITEDLKETKLQPNCRLRNSVLAEIQSKLARHINRQGIMNL